MSTLMMSELLADLSLEQQQLLAGGVNGDETETESETNLEDEGSDDSEYSDSMFDKKSGVYLIKSRSIVRVRKLKKS
ncbi:hypothetical protein I8751_06860 [Nostocaceae cyanobacterium CENA357]|uniref:Uncharacterized protein n=1 Tax=Atlanticothrix silvestris CENA357 TaxID=1725252 RepID=A0A8J7HGV7_9CYAN|nr:hypothetical protein [Atlanticothrix silvestris]MBH8552093.1 hypothetical protein [Atlanticothrix silvestris CENA357]